MSKKSEEDWTLSGKLAKTRAAKGGRELTAAEIENVKAQHDEIATAQKALDDYLAKAEAKRREQEIEEIKAEIEKVKAQHDEIVAAQKTLDDYLAKAEAEKREQEIEEIKEKAEVECYQNIVFAFSDLLAAHAPLIGDCSMLPYPKKTILYAIEWVMAHYATMREATINGTLREKYDEIMPTLSYLLTVLARDWHEIDPDDKDAIAELGRFDSFPDWALPLKLKYINDEKASHEAFDATFKVLKDRVGAMRVNPSDPDFGSRNKLFTKARADAARARLKEIWSRSNVGIDTAAGRKKTSK